MSDHVFAGQLSESELEALISALKGLLTDSVLEAVDQVVFDSLGEPIDLNRYDSGRVFGPDAEVRWERQDNVFYVVAIGDINTMTRAPKEHQLELDTNNFEKQQSSYYLWGEWNSKNPQWLEASIPHVFRYPSPAAEGAFRRKIKTVEYVCKATGAIEFYRFAGTEQEAQ